MPSRLETELTNSSDSIQEEPQIVEVSPIAAIEPVEDTGDVPISLSPIEKSIFVSEIAEQIREVYDPEIPVNVYDLGLIYDIQVDAKKNVHIVMTLTSPGCPVAGILPGEVQMAAMQTPGIGNVTVELTWDPPFTIDMIPYEIRVALGFE